MPGREDETRAPQATVLVGINGGPGTHALLRVAAKHAGCTGAALLVAHVVRVPTAMFPDTPYLDEQPPAHEVAARLFPDLVEALFDSDVPCELVTANGDPAVSLARLAIQRAVLAVVVGADAPGVRGQLRRLLTGSVPYRLTQLQPAPVIIVPAGCSRAAKIAARAARSGR